jgi:redox-sensitive bicupin YhaK (pirin superfamily)
VTIAPDRDSLLLPGHDVPIGRYTTVRRLLPQRERRMVGPWCFVDHFRDVYERKRNDGGPVDVANEPGMQIPPHPHTGLQTVTWLVDGEILHRDSLGSAQPIVPGQLNLMTAGRGIAHSEQSPPDPHPPPRYHFKVMHGLQLWVALPDAARHTEPAFEHHPGMPVVEEAGASVTVVVGEIGGARSPARAYSPIVGAEITLPPGTSSRLPLETGFEYAVLSLTGEADVAGVALAPGSLLYLGSGKSNLDLRAAASARLFLLGGEPFDEPLVMWWNFVGRTHDEIVQARADWAAGRRFGPVAGCEAEGAGGGGPLGQGLPAPAMPTTRLKARDRHGVASVTN